MTTGKLIIAVAIGGSIFSMAATAQITNLVPAPPPTILETWESATGQLVVKGTALIGTLNLEGVAVTVTVKEDVIVSTGHKEYGITVGIRPNGQTEDRTIIDYDELDSLLNSIDFLSRINWSVTTLSSFDAGYTTKGGLRVSGFSSKRAGQIEFALRSARMVKGVLLAPDQLAQLRSFVDQAKRKVETLRQS